MWKRLELRGGSQMEAGWNRRWKCVLEGWEGGKEKGDEDCAALGSRGCLLGGKHRAAPPDQRFVKGKLCEFSLLSGPQRKNAVASVTVLTLVALSRMSGDLFQGQEAEEDPWGHHTPGCE